MSYLYGDNLLIDIGDWHEDYENVQTVLLTHVHFDHIYGLNRLLEHTPNAVIYTNEFGYKALFDSKLNLSFYSEYPEFKLDTDKNICILKDSSKIILDNCEVKAIPTPGHNPSCITWEIKDCLFTGDSYIPGIKTVTNIPKANKREADNSVKLILELSKEKRIFPGHKI